MSESDDKQLLQHKSAMSIQRLVRGHLLRRNLNAILFTKRLERRTRRSPFHCNLDVCSMRCLRIIQRVGKGLLGRVWLFKKATRMIAALSQSTRRRSSVSIHKPHPVKQRWLPLGYNPPKSAEDRLERLRAVYQLTKLKAALKIQQWWRSMARKDCEALHAQRMLGLIFLNMKAIVIQRWWRCQLRGKKFIKPTERDVKAAAEAIVSAEELKIQRDHQLHGLRRLWRWALTNDGGERKRTKQSSTSNDSRHVRNGSNRSSLVGSVPSDSQLSLIVVNAAVAGMRRGTLAALECKAPVPKYLSGIEKRAQRVPKKLPPLGSRYASSEEVAKARGLGEWNDSKGIRPPAWCSPPH